MKMPFIAAAVLAAQTLTPFAQDTETRVPTNGIELNVKTWGDPADEAVVLMHGWMGTSHTWRKLAPLLAEDRFVIVPDMRGHGASDKPDAGYDAVGLAADIKGLLDHFGKTEAHVVGHDMGALVSLAFAGTYPETALSMTYLDEPLIGYNLDQFTVYREETYGGYWHFGFNSAPGLAEILVEGKEQAFVDWFVPLMHAPNPDAVTAEDRAIYAEGLKTENGISGSVGWYRATFETARQLRALGDAGIDVPMMAWGGEYGVPVTHSQFEAISEDVRGGIIPGMGHLLPEEAPDFLAAELNSFFTQTEAR
ncbi:MAG: alpha/beta hydrolase [Hoeflea sp.]|uniref:alpha/beta fold hydrolase n=1 Tax=Hoeflea sp. TaxID=1940281 RepID=UPI0032EDCD40